MVFRARVALHLSADPLNISKEVSRRAEDLDIQEVAVDIQDVVEMSTWAKAEGMEMVDFKTTTRVVQATGERSSRSMLNRCLEARVYLLRVWTSGNKAREYRCTR